MNESSPSSSPRARLPWRLLCWLFSWRIHRRVLFLFACLATLVALAITEENWRGRRAWEKFKREWETKGERFDLASVLPPAVPDTQNFAKAPIFAGAFNLKSDPETGDLKPVDPTIPDRLNISVFGKNDKIASPTFGSRQKGVHTDLKGWQQYYRALATNSAVELSKEGQRKNEFPIPAQPGTPAADVLLALSRYDSAIEELREAAKRPSSRFPLNYEDGFRAASDSLGPIARFKACGQVLRLRAMAELANGQSEMALNDVQLFFRLLKSIGDEPFLIDHLVRIAMFELLLDVIWEGQASHQWSDAQLVEMETNLGTLDFLADYGRVMRGERAFAVWSIDAMRYFGSFMPSGWSYQNQIAICRMQLKYLLPMVDIDHRVVSPERVRQITTEFKSSHHFSMYDAFSMNLFPALAKANQRFARSQCDLDLASVALAVERFRLARGNFPDSLDALVPQSIEKLPHDAINGQPLKYRKQEDGSFVIYSIGWNQADDGGVIGTKKDGALDLEKGDWVWRL